MTKPTAMRHVVDRRRERLDMRDDIDLRHLLAIIAERAPKLVDHALDLQDRDAVEARWDYEDNERWEHLAAADPEERP